MLGEKGKVRMRSSRVEAQALVLMTMAITPTALSREFYTSFK
jgi:hypothetical protein